MPPEMNLEFTRDGPYDGVLLNANEGGKDESRHFRPVPMPPRTNAGLTAGSRPFISRPVKQHARRFGPAHGHRDRDALLRRIL